MTVELTDGEAREVASILRSNEEALIAEFATEPVDVDDTDGGEWANELEDRAGVDRFDELWEQYAEMDRDISARLGLEPLTDDDGDRKERARELWEAGRLTFVAGNPVITPDDNDR